MTHITHVTLNTGHLRESPRSEVGSEVIRLLDPIIAAGGGSIPGMADMRVEIKSAQPGRAIIIYSLTDGVCAVSVLAWQDDAAEIAWDSLTRLAAEQSRVTGCALPPLTRPGTTPWMAVQLAPPAALLSSDALMQMADLERCLAWTILAREGLAQ